MRLDLVRVRALEVREVCAQLALGASIVWSGLAAWRVSRPAAPVRLVRGLVAFATARSATIVLLERSLSP